MNPPYQCLVALSDSASLFEKLFAIAPVARHVCDTSGKTIAVNPAYVALFGSVPPPGHNVFRDGLAGRKDLITLLETAISGVPFCFLSIWHARKAGPGTESPVALRIEAVPVRDSTGAVRYVSIAYQDITAEEKLRESELRLQKAHRIASSAMWELDLTDLENLEANRLFWSEEAFRLLGFEPGEVEPSNGFFFDLIPPGDREALRRALAKAIARKNPCVLEHHVRRKDGSERIFLEHTEILCDPADGRPLKLFGVAQDVTELKRTQQALFESENHLKKAQEVAHLGSWEMDLLEPENLEKNPLAWSDETFRIWGYGPDEIESTCGFVTESLHPEDREAAWAAVRKSVQDRKPYSSEYRIRRRDGAWRTIVEHGDVIADPATGRLLRLFGTVQDVTEQRDLEGRFLHAQKMEAVGRLTGGVAHDFNNLLTVITGYATVLERLLPEGARGRAECAEILRASSRASDLTRQLLAFSRKQVLQPKPLSLNDTVRGLDKMLHRLVGEDVKVELRPAAELPVTYADPGQIEQVILNLVVNARDAMPGGGELTIETGNVVLGEESIQGEEGTPAGPYVQLLVRDTGCGMDRETLSRIFEPFYTTKKAGKGTGLGLSTVYGIVKQSGGRIAVESDIGKGTAFKIYLPCYESSASVAENGKLPAAGPSTGRETILVVEDDPMVRRLVKEALREMGYNVLAPETSEEIFTLAERYNQKIDLLLTDVILPRTNGRAVAERLQELRPGLRVLYMSGYTDDILAPHGILEKGIHYLSKPFTPDSLGRKIREVLEKQAA
ncbi:MAG: PAS domain-containing protein [Bdellovibrionota bacterium]